MGPFFSVAPYQLSHRLELVHGKTALKYAFYLCFLKYFFNYSCCLYRFFFHSWSERILSLMISKAIFMALHFCAAVNLLWLYQAQSCFGRTLTLWLLIIVAIPIIQWSHKNHQSPPPLPRLLKKSVFVHLAKTVSKLKTNWLFEAAALCLDYTVTTTINRISVKCTNRWTQKLFWQPNNILPLIDAA